VKALIDFDNAAIFSIPLVAGHDGRSAHEGMLIEGPQGWGEFSPPAGSTVSEAARWLMAAIEPGTVGWPDPVRGRVPVAAAVAAVGPQDAHRIVSASGCASADVQVADNPDSLDDDIARLEAVRAALGPQGAIRCVAGARWDVDAAIAAIPLLDKAAGGLEYVDQPCAVVKDSAAVRRKTGVRVALRIAGDEPITDAADIAILTVGPLGGVRRALRAAERCGLPCLVATTLVTSIGIAGGLALAGVLPELDSACALGTIAVLSGDLVSTGRSLVPTDGYLPVAPMPPGPDPALVERFAVTEPAAISHWRNLLQAARHSPLW